MPDWNRIRRDFPVTERCAYFLSAAMSPLPTSVFEAIIGEYRTLLLDGDIHFDDDLKRCGALYTGLADHLNSKAENIVFVANTSTAMSLVALSFGDRAPRPFNVVSLEDEFPSSTIGFEHRGIEMRYARPIEGRYTIDSILDMTDRRTLAVVASYVQYATGFRLDIESLGRVLKEREIVFVVNATQGFPFYPIDVEAMHIDVLSASLHKWGMTGHIGAMFYTSAAFREKYPSPLAGWLSVVGEEGEHIHIAKNAPFRLRTSARQYNQGTSNLQTILAFQAAFNYMKKIGFENIRLRIAELTDYLMAALKRLGIRIMSPAARPEERSAIVAFTMGEGNSRYVDALAAKDIHVSLRNGLIRVSLNIFNDFSDIDRLRDALMEIAGNIS